VGLYVSRGRRFEVQHQRVFGRVGDLEHAHFDATREEQEGLVALAAQRHTFVAAHTEELRRRLRGFGARPRRLRAQHRVVH
jgi:hypothetical protein